jgi:hypothetical protein
LKGRERDVGKSSGADERDSHGRNEGRFISVRRRGNHPLIRCPNSSFPKD